MYVSNANNSLEVSMAAALAEQMDRRLPQLEKLITIASRPEDVLGELRKHLFRCPNVTLNGAKL